MTCPKLLDHATLVGTPVATQGTATISGADLTWTITHVHRPDHADVLGQGEPGRLRRPPHERAHRAAGRKLLRQLHDRSPDAALDADEDLRPGERIRREAGPDHHVHADRAQRLGRDGDGATAVDAMGNGARSRHARAARCRLPDPRRAATRPGRCRSLAPGATKTVSFSVIVDADAAGDRSSTTS